MTYRHRVSSLLFLFVATAVTLLAVSPAMAHRLNVFVLPEGDRVVGEAYFNDGAPVKDCPVRLVDAEGKVLQEGRTDGGGGFALALPEGVTNLTVVVEGGMGHRGETSLKLSPRKQPSPVSTQAPSTPAPVESPTAPALSADEVEALVRQAVKREITPLKEEILRLNQELSRPGTTEIMGGLGYIVGLTGIALWAGSRKKNG